MRKHRGIYFKWQISLITLFIFCIGLVPFPNRVIEPKAETATTSKPTKNESVAVLVGDLMEVNGLGANWNPSNYKGRLEQFKSGIYEVTLRVKKGNYNYKIAMNGNWDESYGNNGENIELNVLSDQDITFRLDYNNQKVYDSLNNPDKFKTMAVLTGNIANLIEGATDWNPGNNTLELEYIGGGLYQKTFAIKESVQADNYNLEYKVAYNGNWNNGEIANNVKVNIPSGTKNITILADYLGNYVVDSITNPNIEKIVSLIGTIRGGDADWDTENTSFDMHIIDSNKVLYSNIIQKGIYEYKGIINRSWDGGGIPSSSSNIKINIPETKNVVFIADLQEGTIIDSVNDLSSIDDALEGNDGDIENPVESPIINKDGTVTFRVKHNEETLYLVGTMNGWNEKEPIEMKKNSEGIFQVTLNLEPGSYEYKYIPVKGSWDNSFKDPGNPKESNGNSLVVIRGQSTIKSPEVNSDGTVTFRADYSGEELYLIGSMVGWSIDKQIKMTKDENGVFFVTLPMNGGKYEYKFKPHKDSWDDAFVDVANDLISNGNSLVNVPGLEITSPMNIELGMELQLNAKLYNLEGNSIEANPTWQIEEEVSGVCIENGNILKVSKDADTSKKIKVRATEGSYTSTIEIEILSNMYTYKINYYRPAKDYNNWNLWLWENGKDGKQYDFNVKEGVEEGFVQAEYKFASNKINFIVRKGNWEDKDIPFDRVINVREGKTVEVWLVQNDPNVYYSKADIDLSAKYKAAIMDSKDEILVTASEKIKDSELQTIILKDKINDKSLPVEVTRISDSQVILKLKKQLFRTNSFDVRNIYEVSSENFSPVKVTIRKILDDSDYYYSGKDLGLTYTNENSMFKVWAPTATKVSVAIYNDQGVYNDMGKVTDNTGGREIAMKRQNNGVWALTINEDLVDKYYLYKVEFADGKVNYAVDPYAKATSANGQRTAIVDLSLINPGGWGTIPKPTFIEFNDAIIYEMHVRDFSISENSGANNKGKFEGIAQEGTKLSGTNVSTGVDHLKELGVTHVHLLPSYDYASINEMSTEAQFNWGYDPQNYNVVEGSYSTDAQSPTVRIKEFKDMVQSLHKNGIRVVMDVVYNHTYSIGENSPFDPVVPGYYYRSDDVGAYTNGSGCGNEIASERPMVRKYIKDSVKYWAEEYDVDGFRFDLMGLIDTKTMTELTNELRAEVDPTILVYGEPWQAGGSALPAGQQTLKGSQKDNGFAVFNDNFRGAIKGGSDDATTGFATGATGKEGEIVKGIRGSIDDFTNGPNEVINYVTAHDNLNLWDKILKAADKDTEAGFLEIKDGKLTGGDAEKYSSVAEAIAQKAKPYSVITEENPLDNEYVKRSILTTGIIMTSQGIPFFQAGDEFLRTKYGDHNSYKSPDDINKINWQNKDKYKEIFDYYQGLISLRKSHPAFRMNTKDAINSNLFVTKSNDNIVVFELRNFANGDGWKNIVVAYNANTIEKEISLSQTADWNVVVNDKKSGTEVIETLENSNKAIVKPLSIMVLYDESIEAVEQVPTTIEVNSTNIGIALNGFNFVKATVKDQNGRTINNPNLNWNVEDESLISIDEVSGKITGKKLGTTKIALTAGNVKTIVDVTVAELVPTSIEIKGANNLFEGKSIELQAIVKDQFNQLMLNPEVNWSSSDEGICTVNNLGVAQGIAKGNVIITAKVGKVSSTKELQINKYTKKYVEFTYVREDKNYDGWNIWTWQTGVKDGQQDFTTIKDGVATAKFEIAPDAASVGFVLRKGTGWDEKDPYDSDRYIKVDPSMIVTKVTVTSGVGEFLQVPSIKGAEINKGTLDFKYRDEELYQISNQESIDKVQVKVTSQGLLFRNTEIYDMTYNKNNQYFSYSLNNIKNGVYKYSFLITKNGQTIEVQDPTNKDGVIEYRSLDIGGTANPSIKSIDYDQNTVITLNLSGKDANINSIKEIYMDLSELGGSSRVNMDLALLNHGQISQAISVKDSVPTGDKTVKVVVVDINGEEHIVETVVTVNSKVAVGPLDFGFDEARIYFTMTDRFFNGDRSNDDPNNIEYDKNNPFTYHGGDLKGLSEKVPYLKELGINTIWITPIVENTDFNQMFAQSKEQYSYHGYWAKNFEVLDPHLGTMDDLKNLIDTAHENGIKIMVDVVLNHAGYGMKTNDSNLGASNYPTDEDRKIFEGMFRINPGNDFTTEEVSGLPDFKTEDPEVRARLIEWQTAWIDKAKTEKGNTIDYFRVDTVKHVDNATWKAFKSAQVEKDANFKMIGEYFGADVNTTEGQLNSGQMDGLLDFMYQSKAVDFVNGKIDETSRYLDDRASKIDNTTVMGQFLSNHDEDPFLTYVNGDLDKQMLAASLQITDKGIPVIYYGEEIGMYGKNGMENGDSNRYDMDWNRLNDENYSKVFNHYKKMLNIRDKYSLTFAKGERKTIGGSNEEKYTVFARDYEKESIIVALNTDKSIKTVTVKTNFAPMSMVNDVYNNKEYLVDGNGNVAFELPSIENGGTVVLAINNKYTKALEIAVEEANNITEEQLSKVIPVVVEEFKSALKEAKEILSDKGTTQEQIDKSFERLSKVMQMLSFYKGDKTELLSLIDKIEELNEQEFIKSTWNKLQNILISSKKVANDANAMEDEVRDAYNTLMKTYLELRLKPNKDKLQELINKANDLDKNKYTSETWSVFEEAKIYALEVLKNDEASDVEVVTAIKNLNESMNKLKYKGASPETAEKDTGFNKGNNKNEKLPNTGGTNSIYIIIISIGIVCGGIALFLKKQSKK